MKPIEAFWQAVFYVSGLCSQRMLNKPGAVIEKLRPETREALSQLKSTDIDGSTDRDDQVRYYCIGSEEYYKNKKFEKVKLEFDKKIIK